MLVINKSILLSLIQHYSTFAYPIKSWLALVKSADWKAEQEIKDTFPRSFFKQGQITTEIVPNHCFLTYSVNLCAQVIFIDSFCFSTPSQDTFAQSPLCSEQKRRNDFLYIWNEEDYKEALRHLLALWNSETASPERIETQAEIIEAYESTRWPIDNPSPRHLVNFYKQQNNKKAKDLAVLLKAFEDLKMPLNKRVISTFKSAWHLYKEWNIPIECLLEWELSMLKQYSPFRTIGKKS